METWKAVAAPGFEAAYEVSDTGLVRNCRTGHVLTPMRTGGKRKQYSTVLLCQGGMQKSYKVHALVLMAFVGARPEGTIGCHRDDDTRNNVLGNLYWGTWSQNAKDRVRNGKHAGARLTLEQTRDIKRRRAAGESGKSLAEEFGVSQQVVWNVYSGRTGGYE